MKACCKPVTNITTVKDECARLNSYQLYGIAAINYTIGEASVNNCDIAVLSMHNRARVDCVKGENAELYPDRAVFSIQKGLPVVNLNIAKYTLRKQQTILLYTDTTFE